MLNIPLKPAFGTAALLVLLLAACTPENELPDPVQAWWEGASVCEVLEENRHMRALRCTFPPGGGHERHFHDRHFGYTVQGSRFRITDATGTREVDVTTGGHFYSDGIEWHEVLNIGDSTAVFLIIELR
ncbi:Cupin domain protein [Cyclonatronum proteinivorum]|uniref:Cupin domain protein n=1 Tax=Cyclonatronum proteinivorum TaxID=1457365 RepID=A0A345UIF9_9BACT|nr:cupin domain-containing protein [Cyclonatronum proteinivorum]AXJ00261.1 Cupin domain protein [Cyclonatronum proteinivorum]